MDKIKIILLMIFLSSILNAKVQKTTHNTEITDPKILFQENFEDTDFALRGWYDALQGNITNAEYIVFIAALTAKNIMQENIIKVHRV